MTKEMLYMILNKMNYQQIASLITDEMQEMYFQVHPELTVAVNKDIVLFGWDNNLLDLNKLPKLTDEDIDLYLSNSNEDV